MGWCHEFGPQILEGCDHPMVAEATSCTCGECGSTCNGKFAGCVDVWARGPRLVAVRATTARRLEDLRPPDNEEAAEGEAGSPEPEGATTGQVDDAVRTLLDQFALRCEGLEAKAAGIDALAQARADFRSTTEAVAAIARRLDQVSARLAPLEELPARLDRLASAAPPPPAPGPEEIGALVEGVKALDGRLSSLEDVARNLQALDQQRGRLVALDKVVAGLVKGGERLAGRVEALEAAPAPEVAPPGPVIAPAELDVLAERVAALETMPATEPRVPAGLVKQMERLVNELAALDGTPERLRAVEATTERLKALEHEVTTLAGAVGDLTGKLPAGPEVRTTPRIEALDAVVADIVQNLGQLSSKLAGLDEVPKRIEALEQAPSPSEKVVASLAKRVDRLSTAAASVKDMPQRIQALEQAAGEAPDQASDRTDALAVGLGHAIDMIDQLAHQVAVLEQAVGDARTTTS
jgi:DNA repair ATPase RecN